MLIEIYIEDEYITLKSPKYSNKQEVVVGITPTKELYNRVRTLSGLVKATNCAYIEDWDYSPNFDELSLEGIEGDSNVDVCRMRVDKNTVHWEGMLKHTNIHVYTEHVPIKKLFKKFIGRSS